MKILKNMNKKLNLLLAVLVAASTIAVTSCGDDTVVVFTGRTVFGVVPVGVIYAAEGTRGSSGLLYVVNPTTETIAVVGPIGYAIGAMAVAPDGRLFGLTNDSRWGDDTEGDDLEYLVQINPATGEARIIGATQFEGTNFGPWTGATFVGDTLYAVTSQSAGNSGDTNKLVTVNLTTGQVTPVEDGAPGSFGNGLAYDEENEELLIAPDGEDDDIEIVDLMDASTTTKVSMDGTEDQPINSMTFVGNRLIGVRGHYSRGGTYLVEIDTSDGSLDYIYRLPGGIDAIASR